MVSIRCRTNLDLHHCEEWPRELVARPMKGDIITSSTGLELEVVRCSFSFGGGLDVELHLPQYRFENIHTFEKWYWERKR